MFASGVCLQHDKVSQAAHPDQGLLDAANSGHLCTQRQLEVAHCPAHLRQRSARDVTCWRRLGLGADSSSHSQQRLQLLLAAAYSTALSESGAPFHLKQGLQRLMAEDHSGLPAKQQQAIETQSADSLAGEGCSKAGPALPQAQLDQWLPVCVDQIEGEHAHRHRDLLEHAGVSTWAAEATMRACGQLSCFEHASLK